MANEISIVRRLDDLGRIVIPKDVRKVVGLQTGDPVQLTVSGKTITITKHLPEGLGSSAMLCVETLLRRGVRASIYDTEGQLLYGIGQRVITLELVDDDKLFTIKGADNSPIAHVVVDSNGFDRNTVLAICDYIEIEILNK